MSSRVRPACLLGLSSICGLIAVGGCGGNFAASKPSNTATVKDPAACAAARLDRDKVPGLVDAGRLHTAADVLAKANATCPEEAATTATLEVNVLAELGDWDQLRKLGERLDGDANLPTEVRQSLANARSEMARRDVRLPDTPEAKSSMRAIYRQAVEAQRAGANEEAYDLFLKSWDAWHPNGQALLQAGVLASRLGRAADAQRLFDRGLLELERVTESAVTVEVPHGIDDVSSVAWSPLGRIAVASGSGLSILAQNSLQDALTVDTQGQPIDCVYNECVVAFSPDGKLVALGQRGSVGFWDASTGAPAGTIQDLGSVHALAWSSDGALLAVGAVGEDVALYATSTRTLLRNLTGHATDTTGLAFGPKGESVAASFDDGTVRSWRTADGRPGTPWKGPAETTALAYSPKGAIVIGDRVGRVHVLDEHMVESRVLDVGSTFDGVTTLAFAPDGKTLAVGGDGDVDLGLVDTTTWSVRPLEVASWVTGLAFSADSQNVVFALGDGSVAIANASTGAELQRRAPTGPTILRVGLTPEPTRLVVIGRESRLRIFDLANGTLHTINPFAEQEKRFSDIERRIRARVEAKTGVKLEELSRPQSLFGAGLAFAPDGAIVTNFGPPQVWELATGELRRELAGVPGEVLAVSRQGLVVAGDERGDLATRSLEGEELPPFDGLMASDVVFSPDGSRLLALRRRVPGGGEERLEMWSTAHRKVEWSQARPLYLGQAAFRPNGTEFAIAGASLTIADATTGQARLTIEGLARAVAYSPDGTRIALGVLGRGPSLRLLDPSTGDIVLDVPLSEPISSLAFSSDGGLLVAGSERGTVTLFKLPGVTPIATIVPVATKDATYVLGPGGAIEVIGGDAAEARAKALCRVGPYTFEFAVCAERFERSGLLASVATAF